ncbi:uncharacterized protein UDID_04595 [Ustilago sp. UG-2017a]|nr:uncharacterized protein UDID_04595 [Ustilago sp. UG-2017a]
MDLNQQRDDPHGVQRLLGILRRQQDSSSSSTAASNPLAAAPPLSAATASSYTPANPFASTTKPSAAQDSEVAKRCRLYNNPSSKYFIAALGKTDWIPTQSLPILSTLAKDKSLLRRLKTLRTQQHDLEKRLVKEYKQFSATADKQYPNPKVRAAEDEKRKKQMLKQWDECVKKQQEELERAGLPTFRKTGEKRDVEKQKKVLGVLVEMLDDDEGGS